MFKQRRTVYLIKGNNRAKLKKPVKRRYYGFNLYNIQVVVLQSVESYHNVINIITFIKDATTWNTICI